MTIFKHTQAHSQVKTYCWVALLLLLSLNARQLIADEKKPVAEQELPKIPKLFFDANSTSFDREGKEQIFDGNVVAMMGGNLVWADHLSLDRTKSIFKAEGHVFVVNASQVMGGDDLLYNYDTDDFHISNAFLIANDPKRVQELSQKVLGVTPQEVNFEAERQIRMQEIEEKKGKLRNSFRDGPVSQRSTIIVHYALLLERAKLISAQENPILAHASSQKRESILNRRHFWAESQKEAVKVNAPLPGGYVSIRGEKITRTERSHYQAEKAVMTPCYCEEDETPAWGMRAHKIDTFSGGYADLYNAMIEIKGVPVFYLPFLRIPVKGERQSGLLVPTFGYNQLNGSVYSQPVFFDMGKDQDLTVTFDFLEKRGARLGTEYRIQQRTYSGWEIQGEAIRDSKWLELKDERREISRSYQDGLHQARATHQGQTLPSVRASQYTSSFLNDPKWWTDIGWQKCLKEEDFDTCAQRLDSYMSSPGNDWRHKMEWGGQSFLTPRLSFVSSGRLLSDHRYMQDLYFERFKESFKPDQPNLFSTTQAQLHMDGSDFYLGLGSSWGDQMTLENRFSGHQIPYSVRMSTRMFTLWEKPKPFYMRVSLSHKKLSLFEDSAFAKVPDDRLFVKLDSGDWTQVKGNIIAPLVTKQIFRLDHFTELELRAVNAGYNLRGFESDFERVRESPGDFSTIRTLKTGLAFHLPIDGSMELKSLDNGKDEERTFLTHKMDWGMTLSLRPSVVRKGNYGHTKAIYNPSDQGLVPKGDSQSLVYFDSDSPETFDNELLPEEERMIPHQRIIFGTSHDWGTYKTSWAQSLAYQAPSGSTTDTPFFYKKQAEWELYRSLYMKRFKKSSLPADESEEQGVYTVEQSRSQLLHVDANMSYDYKKEMLRREREEANESVTGLAFQPWSPARINASVSLLGWSVSSFSKYNIYDKTISEMNFGLAPPSFFGTSLALGYLIEKEVSYDTEGSQAVNRTLTRNYSLSTTLIPRIGLSGAYGIRTKYNREPPNEYAAAFTAEYGSPSRCWALQLSWKKEFPEIDWKGTYFLSLVVQFFNYRQNYGNLFTKINQRNKPEPGVL
ncbi:MAG: LPS-assembly protein LptD [Deltaproteobacteria bacterium]|nr:LPS-assembly protein LptD [Deltaproteobacteria bacterium]